MRSVSCSPLQGLVASHTFVVTLFPVRLLSDTSTWNPHNVVSHSALIELLWFPMNTVHSQRPSVLKAVWELHAILNQRFYLDSNQTVLDFVQRIGQINLSLNLSLNLDRWCGWFFFCFWDFVFQRENAGTDPSRPVGLNKSLLLIDFFYFKNWLLFFLFCSHCTTCFGVHSATFMNDILTKKQLRNLEISSDRRVD